MNQTPSKADIDRRAEQLNPISPRYYEDRGYTPEAAVELAASTQRHLLLVASHKKQAQKRKRD
jgi:hypothetical protein